MSSLIERLRALHLPSAMRPGSDGELPVKGPAGADHPQEALDTESEHDVRDLKPCAAETLGGEWVADGAHRYMVVERKYPPGHRHGRVAVCDAAPGTDGWRALRLLGGESHADSTTAGAGRLLFLDLETTGLSGGAGTYAFLVGCGWFDGGTFRVRQYFLSAFGAERHLLTAVAALADGAAGIVTYNGKTFDLPVLETRYVLHRMQAPFTEMPHIDMLHPARRLWRSDDSEASSGSGCRLTMLERALCGHERVGDVPGFEIPSRYFHYVRSGDARPLEAVLEHNRLDLLSLALFTARASQLLADGPAAAATAREAYGMGGLYERAGLLMEAAASFARAADIAVDTELKACALRATAVVERRQRRFAEAADAWRKLLALAGCPAPLAREATEALAVHHEHRVRDLEQARRFAVQSLRLPASFARKQAAEYRLARLNRKLEGRTAALF
jgi:uncharacterized protein YprB with RNaseH-like and TPR domain